MTLMRTTPFTIEDLPDEVMEFILGLIPPYADLHQCMQVSKRWRRLVLNVARMRQRNLNRAISDFDIAWICVPPEKPPTITKRYSHNAVIHENSMYVFGGCTSSMTTFNDLWRLDLASRQWSRPITTGFYPSPKACSTLARYKDSLVLFGGWTYPPSYPLHQIWHLFNELHLYNIKDNRWISVIVGNTAPPPTAGHSVSIHKEWMVVFGGLHRCSNDVHSTKTDDVWKFNLETWVWSKQKTGRAKPPARYGQSQMALDDENLLIIGGSGGPSFYYSDVWVLNMSEDVWKWIQVEVRNLSDSPGNVWSNPACKVAPSTRYNKSVNEFKFLIS